MAAIFQDGGHYVIFLTLLVYLWIFLYDFEDELFLTFFTSFFFIKKISHGKKSKMAAIFQDGGHWNDIFGLFKYISGSSYPDLEDIKTVFYIFENSGFNSDTRRHPKSANLCTKKPHHPNYKTHKKKPAENNIFLFQ